MLKADLANNDSNGVVGFILYLILSSFSSVSLVSLSFLYELCSYKVIREGCVTLARAVKVFMTVDPPLVWWEGGITVIAGMRAPILRSLRVLWVYLLRPLKLLLTMSRTQTTAAGLLNLFFIGTSALLYPPPLHSLSQ